MAATSREAQLHAEWIGMAQPDGLVVAVPVLEEAGVYVRRPPEDQQALREATPDEVLPDLDTLFTLLGWPAQAVSDDTDAFVTDLPDLDTTLRPDRIVSDRSGAVVLLVSWTDDLPSQTPAGSRWPASHAERFERLLLDQSHPTGLLVSPTEIRLVHAPAGEAPGRLSFPVDALRTTDGRLLLDAMHMLLGPRALFTGPPDARLPKLLVASRKRQEQVTEDLAEQVEVALRILLAGFDTANARSDGSLLREVDPEQLYDGLTTVLLRLVFLLYAEDRELMPMGLGLYAEHYSVTGLADQLQHDAVSHASAMDRRFGAWSRLLSLFRMVWTGARFGDLDLPPREGDLFHPDRFPFLEGRSGEGHQTDRATVPRVDDGVIAAVLDKLLHLRQQRISYRNLEVEQLGSVYEALMGFEVLQAAGPCLTTRPAGVVVELDALREADRPIDALAEWIDDKPAKLRKAVPGLLTFTPTADLDADRLTLQQLLAPIVKKQTELVPPGHHTLQPGHERRRSGSHYTPRSLTEPIVARTLGPILDRDGPPTPERILAMRVCDPAMGSGAFLAEACRYLARRLVEAWGRTGTTPPEALAGDPSLHARRMVAESCLYGVDKNPRAVQLARVSMWLVTSAADLPFTFIDHALKPGDALIGLTIPQIAAFSFDGSGDAPLWEPHLNAAMQSAARIRGQITARQRAMVFGHDQKKSLLRMAEDEVWDERVVGDLLLAAAWDGGSKKAVRDRILRCAGFARAWYPNQDRDPLPDEADAIQRGLPMRPFHWALEFPEVFAGKEPGFDCVVGNPPFGGQESIRQGNGGAAYIKLLQALWPHAHGNSDLAAYFFLRATEILRKKGTFGLVATNTVAQGNSRDTGLKHLLNERDVTLYDATGDMKWPVGGAAVTVRMVNGVRGRWTGEVRLDGEVVDGLGSDLRAGEELADPVKLAANTGLSFLGSKISGQGFVLTLEEADRLRSDPHNREIVRDYLGGEELNSGVPETVDGFVPPTRCVISFGDRSLEEAEDWPELLAIVREKVKPERTRKGRIPTGWWKFERVRPSLYRAIAPLERCLVCSRVTKHLLFAFQPADRVFSERLVVFPFDDLFHFAVLQSRVHDPWAWELSTTMKTDLSYSPSRCFETFPFPRPAQARLTAVAAAGQRLYAARAEVMVARGLGMTQVWNLVVDPGCADRDIEGLRTCREEMDRAVLAAYGWEDLDPEDGPSILARLRKLNARRAAEERRGT